MSASEDRVMAKVIADLADQAQRAEDERDALKGRLEAAESALAAARDNLTKVTEERDELLRRSMRKALGETADDPWAALHESDLAYADGVRDGKAKALRESRVCESCARTGSGDCFVDAREQQREAVVAAAYYWRSGNMDGDTRLRTELHRLSELEALRAKREGA